MVAEGTSQFKQLMALPGISTKAFLELGLNALDSAKTAMRLVLHNIASANKDYANKDYLTASELLFKRLAAKQYVPEMREFKEEFVFPEEVLAAMIAKKDPKKK